LYTVVAVVSLAYSAAIDAATASRDACV